MRNQSVVSDARDVSRATQLIHMDARLQLLECETQLSRERLLRLYKEIHGKSPPKGLLPFSTGWFTTWMPNIHASLFMSIYDCLKQGSELDKADLLIKTYRLYVEQCTTLDMEVVLSVTRAWRMVKFIDAAMLRTIPCTRCHGHFVVRSDDLHPEFVCGLCRPPSRAGKKTIVASVTH